MVRRNLGYSLALANRMDLAAMTPRGDLATTGYCLAAPGKEYLVYQPASGAFDVTLEGPKDVAFAVEWLDPKTGKAVAGKPVSGGATTFTPPFAGDAIVYLKAR